MIMWCPSPAIAAPMAEKGTQVRILGRTRCCIFPSTISLAEFLNSVTASPMRWWEGPTRRAMGMSQKTCLVIVKNNFELSWN